MTELEFELEFKKRKLQKRKQRRMELLIIGAHLGVVLVLLYWMFGIGMVHGRSMRPAYRDGDLFLYQRRLFREPDYGDVVVCTGKSWMRSKRRTHCQTSSLQGSIWMTWDT